MMHYAKILAALLLASNQSEAQIANLHKRLARNSPRHQVHDIATKAKRDRRVGGSRHLSNRLKAENEAKENHQDAAKPKALEISLSMGADALSVTAEARFDSVISQGGSSDSTKTKSGKKSAADSCQDLLSKKGGKKGSCPQGSALFFSGLPSQVGEEGGNALSPRAVNLTRSVLQASAGDSYMLAVDEEGSAIASGYIDSYSFYYGWFGVDRANLEENALNKEKKVTNVIDEGGDVVTAPKFQKVVAGLFHSIFIDTSGHAYAAGRNYEGQLCNDSGDDQDLPQRISLPDGEVAIDAAVGSYHTLILTKSKKVYGCGSNSNGQLGLGNVANRNYPDSGNGLNEVTGISAGFLHSLIETKDGLYGMGRNGDGQLCTGDKEDKKTPVLLNIGNVKSFSAGGFSSYILGDDGNITSCGWNFYGQLGDGTTTASTGTSVDISGIDSEVTDVYSGSTAYSAFISTQDGELYGIGWNSYGQLGVNYSSPNKVLVPLDQVQFNATAPWGGHVSAGGVFTLFW